MKAKISEIFTSIQGEGPYTGVKQLFIRFFGCSFGCSYCDTKPVVYKEFSVDELLLFCEDKLKDVHSVSLTGGEPLEQSDFLEEFTKVFKEKFKKRLYLETNGIMYTEVMKIIDSIDIVSMDYKLSSTSGCTDTDQAHKKFLEAVKNKETIVKAVVSGFTTIEDIVKARSTFMEMVPNASFILQPADVPAEEKISDSKMGRLRSVLSEEIADVRIMPQQHKMLGIK